MIDPGTVATVVGTIVAVAAFGEGVRRSLTKAHQADIDDAVQKERDKQIALRQREAAERELANALERIAELERDRPPRHQRTDGID